MTQTYYGNGIEIDIPVQPNYDDRITVRDSKNGALVHSEAYLDGVTDFQDGSWGITLKLPRPTWKRILLGWLIGDWEIVEYRG